MQSYTVPNATFPYRLHDLIHSFEHTDENTSPITWQPHGRCFKIHDPDAILQVYSDRYNSERYNSSATKPKFTSFLRNINLWGFKRLYRKGPDKGCYYHEFFVKGHRSLCSEINRTSVNGNKVRQKASHRDEPDFYTNERYLYCHYNDTDLDDDGEKRMPIFLPSQNSPVIIAHGTATTAAFGCQQPPQTLEYYCSEGSVPEQQYVEDMPSSPTFCTNDDGRDDHDTFACENFSFYSHDSVNQELQTEMDNIVCMSMSIEDTRDPPPFIENINCFGPEEVDTLFDILGIRK